MNRTESRWFLALLALLIVPQGMLHAAESEREARSANTAWTTIRDDYKAFYSGKRLLRMGLVFSAAAIPANTSIDQDINDWYQDDVRGNSSDDLGKVAKEFGEARYLLPAVVLAAGLDYVLPDNEFAGAIGRFGRRTGRAYLVGLPALLLMQRLTGASRPGEEFHASHWDPIDDDNGVSGHAFAGAVPLLTIARMNEDRPVVRYLFQVLSTLPAWSRVNDASHYPSQAMLGWYMGYESVDAVADSNHRNKLVVAPMVGPNMVALVAGMRF